MINIDNRSAIYLSVFAFVFYQAVNFLYFPAGVTFGDEERFIGEAINLSQTGEFWTFYASRAWEMPLTAIVYSLFYDLTQSELGMIYSVRVFQSLLLIIQAFLIGKIVLVIFNDRKAAGMAFFAMLFYPFFVFYQGLLLSENIFITLLIASFYYLYIWYQKGFKFDRYFLLTNFLFVLTIYSKATLSFLPPIILTLFYWLNNFDINRGLRFFFISVVLFCLFLSPWWVRNHMIFDTFVPFTTSSSRVLYLGNNLNNRTGGNDMRIDWEHDFVRNMGEHGELEESSIFRDRAINFIINNPDKVANLMYLKLKRFYNIFPNAPSFNKGYYKWITFFSYGVVFPLFIISIVYNFSHFKILSPIYILFLYFTLLHVIFIASLRYRLPLEPFMILMASQYLSQMHDKLISHWQNSDVDDIR